MINVEVSWWENQTFEGQLVGDALKRHDIGLLFRFLRSRGVSRLEIASQARIAETRVREIANGKQRVAAYCVLERIAEAFQIPRHLMGLSFSACDHNQDPGAAVHVSLRTGHRPSARLQLASASAPSSQG